MTDEKHMRFRGDGTKPNRYRATKGYDGPVYMMVDVVGEHTVADLLALLDENNVSPEAVTFRGGCFRLVVPATDGDRESWREADEWREANALQSRRAWYERLHAEFGGAA